MTRLMNGGEWLELVLDGPDGRQEIEAFEIEPGGSKRLDFELERGPWRASLQSTSRSAIVVGLIRSGSRLLRSVEGVFRSPGGQVRVVVEWPVVEVERETSAVRRGLRVDDDRWGRGKVLGRWHVHGQWLVEFEDGSRRPRPETALEERKAIRPRRK
jgi:hypothetical protein